MSFASAIHFQSVACHLRADTHGLIGGSSPAGRRGFNFSRRFQAPGSLILGLSCALQACKQSARRFANRLQNSILSAGSTGLAALLDGHQQSRRKIGNVRQCSGEIRHEQR